MQTCSMLGSALILNMTAEYNKNKCVDVFFYNRPAIHSDWMNFCMFPISPVEL